MTILVKPPGVHILFIDTVCNKPYDLNVLHNESLGGTEATVVRVAEGLARCPEIMQVDVMQHNRSTCTGSNPRYIGPADKLKQVPTHIVLLRSPLLLESLRAQFKQAKLYFWAHDEFVWDGWRTFFQIMLNTHTLPICVSKWHQDQMHTFATSLGFSELPSRYIYNPIDDDLLPDDTSTEINKLVYFSSPHKGLKNTLNIFKRLIEIAPLKDMQLFICNPGYHDDQVTHRSSSVINLGKLSHSQALAHVRSSFAVLHLNNECPETFGLVHAEANAVGVPFLNAPVGATPEICPNPQQFVDVENFQNVAERLTAWRMNGRPTVQANANFRLSAITNNWLDMLRPGLLR